MHKQKVYMNFTNLCRILLIFMFVFLLASCSEKEVVVELTETEKTFIKNHPVIKVGVDPAFVPFEFFDENNEYKGIAADYLNLISKRTGLQFEVMKNLTWQQASDLAKMGAIEVLPAISRTEEREEFFIFSEPYYYFKRVIVTQSNDNLTRIEDLQGLTVAVQRESSHEGYLKEYPGINLSLYDSVEVALTQVSVGEERAFVGNLATSNYLIKTNGIPNLRFIAFEPEKSQALYFAAHKNYPEIVSIFNKGLRTITESEKQEINNRWVNLETDIDYSLIIRIAIIVGALVTVIIAVSLYWISKLRNEVEQRKLIQKDLEAAKLEADMANEFKSSFLARMSHEIRTPLNAITGMSYLLKKTDTTMTQRMYIDKIMQSGYNMINVINDILDYSKIEAGKIELEHISFNIDQVIQNTVNIIAYKIKERKINFKFSKDPTIPRWFYGDGKRIEQILLNILNNAIKFSDGGSVTFDIRLVSQISNQYQLAFVVSDTGIGMTEEQILKLFNPFEQADRSITRRFGGSGLGLSIVKNLVDMMGGTIEVQSELNQGSVFTINLTLPIDIDKEEEYIQNLGAKKFEDVRTLVFESTESDNKDITRYLNSFGMDCTVTTTSQETIKILERANLTNPFDVFIIDYEISSDDGFNFVKELHQNKNIVKLPKIVMLLPIMREDLFDRLGEYKIDIGIQKPIIPSILYNNLLDLLNLRKESVSSHVKLDKSTQALINKNYQVLLAEDNKTNQLIAQALLEEIGIKTICANDGSEAIELYNKHKDEIHLVLMDLHMPIMDGYQAAEVIHSMNKDLPIVALTADVILDVKEKCMQSGMKYYISKPFNPDYFIQTIRDLIIESDESKEQNAEIINTEYGIKNMGGNVVLYNKVLTTFKEENIDTIHRLKTAIYDKNYYEALQIIHKLKSSSGSIGAKKVNESATALQKALNEQNENSIFQAFNEFHKLYIKMFDELQKY